MSAEQNLQLQKWSVILTLLATVAITVAWTMQIMQDPLRINLDTAGYLQCAQQVLSGGTIYLDFFDINPPLTIYLHVIPALLSNALNLHIIIVFKLLTGALTLVTIGLTAVILRKSFFTEQWPYVLACLLAESLLGFSFGEEFGQREHLFILLFLPFFFLRWQRWQGQKYNLPLQIICGMLAGIGLFLKPYFFLIPISVELFWLIKYRRFFTMIKAETIVCLISYLCCLAQILFVSTEARNVYLNLILPATVHGYPCFNAGLWRAISMQDYPEVLGLTLLLLAYVGFLSRRSSLLIPTGIWMVASYLIFVIQSKCWPYHVIPLVTGQLLAGGLVLVALATQILPTVQAKFSKSTSVEDVSEEVLTKIFLGVTGSLLACCLFLFVKSSGNAAFALAICPRDLPDRPCPALKTALSKLADKQEAVALMTKYSSAGDRVLFLNTGVSPAYPAMVQMDRRPGSRYSYLQIIAFLEYEKRQTADPTKLAAILKDKNTVLEAILLDVHTRKPRMIFIKQTLYQGCPPGFSLVDCLQSDHKYLDQILQGYRVVDRSLNFVTYVLDKQ